MAPKAYLNWETYPIDEEWLTGEKCREILFKEIFYHPLFHVQAEYELFVIVDYHRLIMKSCDGLPTQKELRDNMERLRKLALELRSLLGDLYQYIEVPEWGNSITSSSYPENMGELGWRLLAVSRAKAFTQKQNEETAKARAITYQKLFDHHWKGGKPTARDFQKLCHDVSALAGHSISMGHIRNILQTKVTPK